MPPALLQITNDTLRYWRASHIMPGRRLRGVAREILRRLPGGKPATLWCGIGDSNVDRPHYRTTSYAADLRANLSNVAARARAWRLAKSASCDRSLLGSCHRARAEFCGSSCAVMTRAPTFSSKNSRELQGTAPQAARRFSLWRTNSRLAAWHSLCVKKETNGWGDYDMENKWAFIEKGRNKGVAVSPPLETPALCIKHKNEEGRHGHPLFLNARGRRLDPAGGHGQQVRGGSAPRMRRCRRSA